MVLVGFFFLFAQLVRAGGNQSATAGNPFGGHANNLGQLLAPSRKPPPGEPQAGAAEIQRWTAVPSPYSRADAYEFVTAIVPRGWATGAEAIFAVCDATSGGVLGSVGLHLDRGGDEAMGEIGFLCAAEAAVAASRHRRWLRCAAGASPRSAWAASTGTPRLATTVRGGSPRRSAS